MGAIAFDLGTILFVITYIIVLVDLRGEDGLINVDHAIWTYVVAFVLAFIYPLTLPVYLVRWTLIAKHKNNKEDKK